MLPNLNFPGALKALLTSTRRLQVGADTQQRHLLFLILYSFYRSQLNRPLTQYCTSNLVQFSCKLLHPFKRSGRNKGIRTDIPCKRSTTRHSHNLTSKPKMFPGNPSNTGHYICCSLSDAFLCRALALIITEFPALYTLQHIQLDQLDRPVPSHGWAKYIGTFAWGGPIFYLGVVDLADPSI